MAVILWHLFIFCIFLIFFVKLFNIYLIKCQEEKLKKQRKNGKQFFFSTDELHLLKNAVHSHPSLEMNSVVSCTRIYPCEL